MARTKSLFVSGCLSFIIIFNIVLAGFSFAQDYDLTFIEPEAGYEATRAYGINDNGSIVGRMDNTAGERQAFVWENSVMSSLIPLISGFDSSTWEINDDGVVSGYSKDTSNNNHAVMWDTSTGPAFDIHTGNVTGNTSSAYGISSNGTVVGMADLPEPELGSVFHAFIYDNVNGFRDLGTLNTSGDYENGYSIAYSVNSSGDVVGIAHDNSWNYRPFIYNEATGMNELSIDSAYPSGEWYASIINDNGLIGGHVIAATNQSLPYVWSNASSTPDAVAMSAAFPYGEVYGMNSSGTMVGSMWDSDADEPLYHAFVFDVVNGIRDLNDLIPPDSGVVLEFARDINASGQIVGYGTQNGIKRAFLLNPSTSSVVPGDANLDGAVNVIDITAGINHVLGVTILTGQAHENADMNNDGVVNINDLIAIVNLILEA